MSLRIATLLAFFLFTTLGLAQQEGDKELVLQDTTSRFSNSLREIEKDLDTREEVREQIVDNRVNQIRDEGKDLEISRLFQSHPGMQVVDPVVEKLLDSALKIQLYEHYLTKIEAFTDSGNEESRKAARIYHELLNSNIYGFNKQQLAEARIFLSSGETVNAYAFSGQPTTTYYEGLIKALNEGELKSVMAHELGHVRAGHVPMAYKIYTILLTGHYYMFSDSISGVNSPERYLQRFNDMIPELSRLSPDQISKQFPNDPLWRSMVANLSHHMGTEQGRVSSSAMTSALTTISEAASVVLNQTIINNGQKHLQDLVLKLEAILVPQELVKAEFAKLSNSMAQSGRPGSRMLANQLQMMAFYNTLGKGLSELSLSKERTADRFAVLGAGEQATKDLLVKFHGGMFGNEDKEKQNKRLQELINKDPALYESFRHSIKPSHPLGAERAEISSKYASSQSYLMINNDFTKALYDYVLLTDVISAMEPNEYRINQQYAQSEELVKQRMKEIAEIVLYLEGKTKRPAFIGHYIAEEYLEKATEEAKLELKRAMHKMEVDLRFSAEEKKIAIEASKTGSQDYRDVYRKYTKALVSEIYYDLKNGNGAKVHLVNTILQESLVKFDSVAFKVLFQEKDSLGYKLKQRITRYHPEALQLVETIENAQKKFAEEVLEERMKQDKAQEQMRQKVMAQMSAQGVNVRFKSAGKSCGGKY
ncbi:MAG: M48 family metalloprotease [Bdellovibrionales bacterium]